MLQRISHYLTMFALTLMLSGFALAQNDEANAIEQLESAGGRVLRIAADTEDREVSLYLAGDSITDEEVALLKSISNIKWLNLANTEVTNAGLANIADLQLNKLHLERTSIGDEGLVHLKNQTELIYLNLYATKVTNEGLKHLSGLKKLRKLYVWQSAVDQTGMDWLSAQLPELEIIGEVKMEAPVVEEEVDEKAKTDEKAKEQTKQDKEKDKAKKSSDK